MALQCPYSARTVPVQCPYSARTQCPYTLRMENREMSCASKEFNNQIYNPLASAVNSLAPNFIGFAMKFVRALCTGTVRALYGHCMGTVRALSGQAIFPQSELTSANPSKMAKAHSLLLIVTVRGRLLIPWDALALVGNYPADQLQQRKDRFAHQA